MRVTDTRLTQLSISGLLVVVFAVVTLLLRQLGLIDVLGIKAIIVLLVAIGLFSLLMGSEESKRKLLYVGFATITIGHRSIYVGTKTYFVALEIILWLLFAVIMVRKVFARDRQGFGIPFLLGLVVLWSILVGVGSSLATENWDSVLAWTSPLVVGLAAFVVVRHLIRTVDHLTTVLTIMMAVAFTMSVLAIIEYEFPIVESTLPWLFTSQSYVSQDGFRRAAFSYFGYSNAATFVTWGLVISYDYFFHTRDWVKRSVALVVFVIGCWAVYISGQRSSWLGVGLALVVLNIPFGIRGVGGVAIIWGVVTQLSNHFWTRVNTVTGYLQRGVVQDSSTEQRINRVNWAWDTIQDKPVIGGGYGHWLTHDVFLEIGSTIGIIPAVAFAVFVVQLVLRLVGTALKGGSAEGRRYGWLFFSLSILWVIQMSIETIFQTPPFAAAHWVMMAVGWSLPEIFAAAPVASVQLTSLSFTQAGLNSDYSLNPNLQL